MEHRNHGTEKENGKISSSLESLDLSRGDEALRLVGVERSAQFSEEYNRRLRRKLDCLIPPICAAVYFTQFLDKTSLNYASIMGLPITGQPYNLVSLAFFLGFLVWEFPSVYISQKLPAAKYLGANILVWGAILMLHAVGTSFPAFFTLRFLLGMCESCVVPILIQIVTMFYKKDEQASRISWFSVMNGLTKIFGGFLAYGISFYSGAHLAPYKIIYFLLGGLAIVVGTIVLIWLPDSPTQARASFLSEEERVAVLERVRDDQCGTVNKELKRDQIVEAFGDVRTWLVVLMMLMLGIPSGGLSSFSNKIIKAFGYTSRQTLILSTPGGAVSSVTTLFCGWYSDKKGERMLPILIAVIPAIVGAAMMIGLSDSGNKGALLVGSYLVETQGSALTVIYAYNASNTSGHTKKSTIHSVSLVAFTVGTIIGTEIFLPKDAPDYIPGKVAIMVLYTIILFIVILLRWINVRLNRKKRALVEEEKVRRGWSEGDVQRERERYAFLDMTDKQNKYFVYTA